LEGKERNHEELSKKNSILATALLIAGCAHLDLSIVLERRLTILIGTSQKEMLYIELNLSLNILRALNHTTSDGNT